MVKKLWIALIFALSVSVLSGCNVNINVPADDDEQAVSETDADTATDNDTGDSTDTAADTVTDTGEDTTADTGEDTTADAGENGLNVTFMGGLVSAEDGSDIRLGIYRIDGDPVAVVIDKDDIYYGLFETEDAKTDDGTEYTLMKINGMEYGFHFNDDNSGFLIDTQKNMIKAGELSEDDGMEMFYHTDMNDVVEDEMGFVGDQSGINDFADFDDVISHLESGQGYAYIKLSGCDDDILACSSLVFEADDTAPEADLFYMHDGKVRYLGVVAGNGSAYPLRLEDGILYGGDNHNYETYFMNPDTNGLMMKDYVNDGIEYGTEEYSGFLRSSNDFEHDEDFAGGSEEFEKLINAREEKSPIVFTRIP